MYSFGANDTLNMCSLARTFVHTHKSLIPIFIKCNQKENDQCIHHFECARWYLLELPDFDFYHFFSTKTHGINDLFLTLRSHCNQCFGFNRCFFFFLHKIFQVKIVQNNRYLQFVKCNNTIFTSCFYWLFFALYKLKWEREKVAIDMRAVIGEESWIQITFRWYVDMVAASM